MGSDSQGSEMVDLVGSPSMWPATVQALVQTDRRHHNIYPRISEMTDGHLFSKEITFADYDHFQELLHSSQSGALHQTSLARLWENRQANAVSLLREQLESLNIERMQAEQKQRQILEEHVLFQNFGAFYTANTTADTCGLTTESPPRCDGYYFEDGPSSWSSMPGSESCVSEVGGDNSAEYWRDRAKGLDKLLSQSIHRENVMSKKLEQSASTALPTQPSVELRQQLERFDNFLRFTLRKAPVVVAHQDKDLRYRFIHNAFPSLTEEEVIGKTDIEIYQGLGVPELMEFKREVLQTGWPDQREIHFDTNLFGVKTFLIAVEPVLSRSGDAIGINYVAVDITEQVGKRERLAHLREEVAVQKAMESELHKTIHITEEAMRAKQMLATMSHEIRSPLSGVVSMAEVLATTPLNSEQRQLVDVMVSSGDLVLQLINDILDLSKAESGAMKLEAKKFRPREVVKHVLQTALVSLQNKQLVLEGVISDDVPLELIGDVLRIRQVFTNLVSNAIKFTHEGGVRIVLRLVPPANSTKESTMDKHSHSSEEECATGSQSFSHARSTHVEAPQSPCVSMSTFSTLSLFSRKQHLKNDGQEPFGSQRHSETSNLGSSAITHSSLSQNSSPFLSRLKLPQPSTLQSAVASRPSELCHGLHNASNCMTCQNEGVTRIVNHPTRTGCEGSPRESPSSTDETLWLHCDISDTGIGIPEAALPSLFERYTQVSTTHARKYGGTGLGLAICKQLVELMDGSLAVSSEENVGSTFSFTLPLGVVRQKSSCGQLMTDEMYCMMSDKQEVNMDRSDGDLAFTKKDGYFYFTNITSSLSSSARSQPTLCFNSRGNPLAAFTTTGSASSSIPSSPDGMGSKEVNCNQRFLRNASDDPLTATKREFSFAHLSNVNSEFGVPVTAKPAVGSLKEDDRYDSQRGGVLEYMDVDLKGETGYFPGLFLPQCKWPGPPVSRNLHGGGSFPQSSPVKARTPTGPSQMGGTMPVGEAKLTEPAASSQGSRRQRPSRILLAEDNKVNVMVAQSMLKRLGHTLEVVSNGAEALQALQRSTYDLILMDVCMPVMDGLEATRCIRKFEATGSWTDTNEAEANQNAGGGSSGFTPDVQFPDVPLQALLRQRTPIIAMTANALADNMLECYSQGMDSFIAKPVTFQKLEQVLRQFIPYLDHHQILEGQV